MSIPATKKKDRCVIRPACFKKEMSGTITEKLYEEMEQQGEQYRVVTMAQRSPEKEKFISDHLLLSNVPAKDWYGNITLKGFDGIGEKKKTNKKKKKKDEKEEKKDTFGNRQYNCDVSIARVVQLNKVYPHLSCGSVWNLDQQCDIFAQGKHKAMVYEVEAENAQGALNQKPMLEKFWEDLKKNWARDMALHAPMLTMQRRFDRGEHDNAMEKWYNYVTWYHDRRHCYMISPMEKGKVYTEKKAKEYLGYDCGVHWRNQDNWRSQLLFDINGQHGEAALFGGINSPYSYNGQFGTSACWHNGMYYLVYML